MQRFVCQKNPDAHRVGVFVTLQTISRAPIRGRRGQRKKNRPGTVSSPDGSESPYDLA